MRRRRTINGAIAGAVGAAVWAAQERVDQQLFGVPYSDVELLGKVVTRGPSWPAAGVALHILNGAIFGAAYANARPFAPVPAVGTGIAAGLAECFATWPLTRFVPAVHPAGEELPALWGNRPALAQAVWRHAVFGAVLGLVEQRLNADLTAEPPTVVPVASNGHGDIAAAIQT